MSRTKVIAQCTPLRPHGMVSGWWSRCMQALLPENNLGHSIFYLRDAVGGEVAENRNALVEQVLEYDHTAEEVIKLLWIDDDVLIFPGALLALHHCDKDIVSGVYFTKRPGILSAPLVYPEKYGGPDRFRPDQLYPVWGHGMGLTMVRTEVYKRMSADLPLGKDKYGHTRWYHTSSIVDVVQNEAGTIEKGFTEDLYFLNNAASIGFQPWVCTHKHTFGWHYDVAKDQGYPDKQWRQWINGEPIVWDTPEGQIIWD